MKRIFFSSAAGLICLLLSFNVFAQSKKMDANKICEERFLSVYKGIESGDLSAMDKFVADDIVDHMGKDVMNGRENIKKMLADIHNHFTNLKLTLISAAAGGEYNFALVRMTGTTTDDKMGMPANTAVDRISVDVVRMKNDKAAEHWSYEDPAMMMNAPKP